MVRMILDWCITSSALIALVLVLRRLVGQRVSPRLRYALNVPRMYDHAVLCSSRAYSMAFMMTSGCMSSTNAPSSSMDVADGVALILFK